MKGIIFTELVNFVERHTSTVVSEQIISQADLDTKGAFTSVGNYPHDEALKLVSSAASILETPPEDLMRQFGGELFEHLVTSHPDFFPEHIDDALSFLSVVQSHIHTEVKKLYPESSPPNVSTVVENGKMIVTYDSHRPFAMIAMGLIEGCCAYFDESLTVVSDSDLGATDSSATFIISANGP
jgi:hypothetical protein